MDDDDRPRKVQPLALGSDLTALTIAECQEYIAALTAEIERVNAAIRQKQALKDRAASVFGTR